MSRPAEEPRRDAAPADPGSTLELSAHDLEEALVAAEADADDSDLLDTEVFGEGARAAVARGGESVELSSSELVDVDGTARLPALAAADAEGALEAGDALEVFAELRPAGRPSLPSVHPSSIAPVALDAARAPAVSLAPTPAAPAARATWIVGAIAAAAAVLVIGVAGAGVVVAKSGTGPARTLQVNTLELAPRAAVDVEASEPADDGAIRLAVATAKEPAPALEDAEASKDAAPADATPPKPRTGTLRFAPGTRDLLIDGAPQATASGQATVACGKHWVKVGAAFGRTVDVPCGGVATLQ